MNKPTFNHTVSVLVMAYFNNTLEHGNYCACAVGNMIADAVGAKLVDSGRPTGSYRTRRGDYRHINQEKYLIPGSTIPRPEHWRMRIVAGETLCIKCKCPYTAAHNPHFL